MQLTVKPNFDYFKTTMPSSRDAEYYLGCLDGSVFMDFGLTDDNLIYLVRISFDGFGCCEIDDVAGCLNKEDSETFIAEIEKNELNQSVFNNLILEIISNSADLIWPEAIEKYKLL